MLVGVQGSLFHIAAGSHPVQEARGPHQQIPLVITIKKRYSLTYLRRTISYTAKSAEHMTCSERVQNMFKMCS